MGEGKQGLSGQPGGEQRAQGKRGEWCCCPKAASPHVPSGTASQGTAAMPAFSKQTDSHEVKVRNQCTEKSRLVTCCFQRLMALARETETAS